jgi:hypothetical protein
MRKILAVAWLLSAIVPVSAQTACPGQPAGTAGISGAGTVQGAGGPSGLSGRTVPGQVNNNPVSNRPSVGYTGPANTNTRTTTVPAPCY